MRRALAPCTLLWIASACSSTPAPASDAGPGDGGLVGDPIRGQMVATASGCASATICHGADLGGSATIPVPGTTVFPQNITPDLQTGIGSWSDAEIERAVREGVNADGRTLCPSMLRFPSLTAQQMTDLVVYLRAVPPVSRVVPSNDCD